MLVCIEGVSIDVIRRYFSHGGLCGLMLELV